MDHNGILYITPTYPIPSIKFLTTKMTRFTNRTPMSLSR
jgi:hypothetical protein